MKKLIKKASCKYGSIQAFCSGCYCGVVTYKSGNPVTNQINK